MSKNVRTLDDVIEANKKAGNHWFDEDTLKFFNSRIVSGLYLPDLLFISSEKGPDNVRGYTIRRFNPETGNIDNHSEFNQFRSRDEALAWADLADEIPGEFEDLNEDELAKAMFLVDCHGDTVEDALASHEDVTRYADMTLADVAEELVNDGLWEVCDVLFNYIDYEKLGHDLVYDGYTEHNGDVFVLGRT